jgi:esterase
MSAIHYQIYSDDESKPWLLLIHGLFGSLDNLSSLRRQFTHSFQVLSIDLPDHGKSAKTDGFSFKHYAQQIQKLIDELCLKNLSIIGHSLGGKVAMQLTLDVQRRIEHLIILDMAPVEYSTRHLDVFKGLNNVNLDSLTSRKQAEQSLNEFVKESSTRQFLLKSLYNQDKIWQWRFNLPLLERDYTKISSAICTTNSYLGPVLFIKGELSDYLLPAHKPAILKLFPNAKSKVIGATGHWLHAEKPELCYKMILSFILANK